MAEDLGDGSSKILSAPPKKKSLFGNPTWSKPPESEEGIDFFSRAKELYPLRVAEEERKRQKKLAKQKQQHKRSSGSAERRASSTPELKRRRVSQAEDNSSNNSPTDGHKDEVFLTNDEHPQSLLPHTNSELEKPSQSSPTSLSALYSRDLVVKAEEAAKNKSMPKGYISLSDSEDIDAESAKRGVVEPISLDDDDDEIYPILRTEPQRVEEDPLMSDEEFPKLVQRARQRERQKEVERHNAVNSFVEKNHANSAAVSAIDDVFQESTTEVDPVVEILVSSCIEGTKPLMVRRKLNQRLKEVRLSWCDKQILAGAPLSPQVKTSIFLTWNGKRLFDASTCKHLGIRTGLDGKFLSEGVGFDAHGRLHFEAWTEDLFMACQHPTQSQKQGGDREEEPEQNQEHMERVKLLLKAKDIEPFRMRVKATTTVEKMARAFRQEKDIPPEKEIALYFDGDRLDPGLRVEDTELADMDTVEVHIR